jgi:hypothetical protein
LTATDPMDVFCPHCRAEPGATCTNYTGAGCAPHADRARSARVRAVRTEVHRLELELTDRRAELVRLLAEAGRRPGDGSDQPGHFDTAAQPRLW